MGVKGHDVPLIRVPEPQVEKPKFRIEKFNNQYTESLFNKLVNPGVMRVKIVSLLLWKESLNEITLLRTFYEP